MDNKNTLNYDLSKTIERLIKKNWGLTRIFNHLKKMQKCKVLSGLGLLRLILEVMSKNGKKYSKEAIRHHFRNKIPKEEWEGSSKHEILKDLYEI